MRRYLPLIQPHQAHRKVFLTNQQQRKIVQILLENFRVFFEVDFFLHHILNGMHTAYGTTLGPCGSIKLRILLPLWFNPKQAGRKVKQILNEPD